MSIQENSGQTSEQRGAARRDEDKVAMSKVELELYVKDGYPTGRLLGSIAALKGLCVEDVSAASGVAVALVKSILSDGRAIRDAKKSVLLRIGDVLGIDLARMRFKREGVHIFDLTKLKAPVNGWTQAEMLRAFGLLARGAIAAKVDISRVSGREVIAVNSDDIRALLFDTKRGLFARPKFSIEAIPAGVWKQRRGSKLPLVVEVVDQELAANIDRRDITEREFDEIFMGTDGLLWDDVKRAARMAGVSRAELMDFIKTTTANVDVLEDERVVRSAEDSRRILRLVEAPDQRAA